MKISNILYNTSPLTFILGFYLSTLDIKYLQIIGFILCIPGIYIVASGYRFDETKVKPYRHDSRLNPLNDPRIMAELIKATSKALHKKKPYGFAYKKNKVEFR